MYDELVEALRLCAKYGKAEDALANAQKAADAIEKLSKPQNTVHLCASCKYQYPECPADTSVVFGSGKGNDNICQCADYVAKIPHWVSVTEKLPEAERKSYWVCTNTGYQCECRWTNNRFGIGESDDWGWSIFDIPQYQKVVAWMPLLRPYEPPKEENNED